MSKDLSEVIGRVLPAPENNLSPEKLEVARKARRSFMGKALAMGAGVAAAAKTAVASAAEGEDVAGGRGRCEGRKPQQGGKNGKGFPGHPNTPQQGRNRSLWGRECACPGPLGKPWRLPFVPRTPI